MTATEFKAKREELIEDGFCVVGNVLDAGFLDELRRFTDRKTAEMSEEHARANVTTGSMIPVKDDEIFARLVTYPPALGVLEKMGFSDLRFSSGFVISKPPHSPRLFWHFDWAAWSHPFSFEKVPPQIFLMYYLVDTNRENGCLRVLPRSHIEHNPLHDELSPAHTGGFLTGEDLTLPEYQDRDDEVEVPVRAGDLVMGDARLLHAAHANDNDQRRTVITLWYHPDFSALPGPIQGYILGTSGYERGWSVELDDQLAAMKPSYDGDDAAEFVRVKLSKEAFERKQVVVPS